MVERHAGQPMRRHRRGRGLPGRVCSCGEPFRRLERTVEGVTYWLTGCPVYQYDREDDALHVGGRAGPDVTA